MANITLKDALVEIESLKAQVAAAKSGARVVTVKVADGSNGKPATGTVNLYGLRAKFPVSLYPGEWDIVFEKADAIRAACATARPIAEAHRAKTRS